MHLLDPAVEKSTTHFPMQSINLIDNQLVKSFVVQIWFRKNGYHLSLNRTEFEGKPTSANIEKKLQAGKESSLNLSGRESYIAKTDKSLYFCNNT